MSRFHKLHKGRWAGTRRAILERDGYRCRTCGKAGLLEVDHIQPVYQGGDAWSATNLQVLCRDCHIRKTQGDRARPDPGRDRWQRLVEKIADGYTHV